jgi:hypothetical protein
MVDPYYDDEGKGGDGEKFELKIEEEPIFVDQG